MAKVFLISDTHFNHFNIIKYCNRPFETIEQMNNTIIENWNKTIKPDDKVFFLGDFGFGTIEHLKELCSKLNGNKEIILGNHDQSKRPNQWRSIGFREAHKYPIIYRNFYILSHEPLFMNDTMPYLNIHGHIHGECLDGKNHFNVSCEVLNYMPIDFEKLIKLAATKE